ncbi:MAG: DUF4382 domain-containing protein [Acidobacteria bacterium]|nr:DUF4382 domain-containing protein [Acidobacteriota bacterium]
MKKRLFLLFVIAAGILSLTGCSDSMGLDLYLTSETTTTVVERGIAPTTETVTALNVTLTEWEVHQTSAGIDSGWVSLSAPSGAIDLMQIRNMEELLSSSEIEEGNYNQIRFYVNTCQVTTASGTYDAEVPSTKINIATQFVVASGDMTEVVLSIDPEASLNVTGNNKYKMQPVIHVKRIKNPN